MLRQLGGRAVAAAVFGMLLCAGPLAFGLAKVNAVHRPAAACVRHALTSRLGAHTQALGLGTNEALAVGASMTPSSTGVTLAVLKRNRCAALASVSFALG
jgi:Kef-type K+ transport system membrane component KefB